MTPGRHPAVPPSTLRPRLTKIVATVGPASSSPASIGDLVRAGVDVFRLNFSHGSHEQHAATIAAIRHAGDEHGRPVAILQDLCGPKIRTGRLAGGRPIALQPGERLVLAVGDFDGGPGRVPLAYAPLASCVGAGDRLLLDDGSLELEVASADGREIVATVVTGGLLGERKGINAPGVELPDGGLTDKDLVDLRFGIAAGVDFVALSFVRSADDMLAARDAVHAGGGHARVLAKIERPEALDRLDGILRASDGVMIARGDLGLEIPLEKVPAAQKDVTRAAIALGLPVILATQVLDSMQRSPRPTRAEVSDAANAVEDSVDAIMLSGETAVGSHPALVVRTLDAIIREAESRVASPGDASTPPCPAPAHVRALCEAALTLARDGGADAIVAVSRRGRTARSLSSLRSARPLWTAVPDEATARSLMLHRGVVPVVVACPPDAALDAGRAEAELVSRGLLDEGTVAVFVALDTTLDAPPANQLRIGRVAGGLKR